ncbi:MAG: hypothetical protein J6A63_08880 [Clostridia bacterium]|nr:hypothetical protein [Clostridia bacterium]
MNNKKRKSKWLGLLGFLALSCVGMSVGALSTETKTASALTYTTPKYLTVGTTNDGSSNSNGCPSNFKIYTYGSYLDGSSTTRGQDIVSNWSYYNFYIDAIDIEHVSFKLYKNDYLYVNKSLSGSSDMTMFSEALSSGDYEMQYVGKKVGFLWITTTYTYTYRFTVDVDAPSYTLKAGGYTINSGSYTNKQVVYTATDNRSVYRIRYLRPNYSSYSNTYSNSYTVSTGSTNGWYYVYAEDYIGNTNSTVSFYLDTVLPVGKVTNASGTTIANGGYTNSAIKYTATDSGSGVSGYQYKKPGATSWSSYTSGTAVTGTGWHTFRSYDRAGNYSEEYKVYYDTGAPSYTLYGGTTSKASGAYTNAEYVKFTASDSYSGLANCYVKMPNSSFYSTYASGTQLATEGLYYFYAVDKSGNETAKVSITLDKTKPTGTLYAGNSAVTSGTATNAAYVKFVPYDSIGLSAMYVKKPNESSYVSYTSGTQFTTEGTYNFYSVDKAGNVSQTYTVTLDRQIPVAQLYVDGNPIDNNGYTNGGHISFECDAVKCYVKLPDSDTFVEYLSGSEYYKAGKYVFYGESVSGTLTEEYSVVIDRTIKTVDLQNVTDGETDGEVIISWTDGNPDEFAPIKSVTVNGKSYTKGQTIYTINTGVYVVSVLDEAGNTWETEFSSSRRNVYTQTLQQEYYEIHDVNGEYFSFASYDSAFAFAVEREKSYVRTGVWNGTSWNTGLAMDSKDSVNALNGTYFIYKKSGKPEEEVAYFTAERLGEVIAEYAAIGINDYYYWEKEPATIADGENLFSYSDAKTILANTVKFDGTVAHFIDGEEYVDTSYEINGFHTLTVVDEWGNTCEYNLTIVRNAPIIGYVVGEGEDVTNTVTFDRTYFFKDQVTVRIRDEFDEMAMFNVYDENGNLLGSFLRDETYVITESGSYTVVAVNHAGLSETFALIISRDAPKVEITENTEGKKLEITVTKSADKESSLQTLEIFKSVDGGETWEILERDDYGHLITTERLDYAFRTTATYKVVVTDEFRTGIDAVTAQASYEQKLPEGELIGVENGGYTNGAVSFEWTDEATVVLTKDGEAITYISGHKLTVDGNYVLTFENFDGYKATYTFTIDTEAPEVTMEGASHREAVNEDVKVFYTEENLKAELFKDGKSLGEYVSGNPISADGQYRVRVYDVAGNEVSVEFSIDKTVEYDINVYDKGLSNSVVVTSHEILTTQLTKDGEKVDYALGSAIKEIGDYTLVLTDALGNNEVITFRIIQPLVQEFTHNFDDIEGFGGVLVNGADKRLNYGTLELFDDGSYEVGVIVGGKTYNFAVTVDGTAPALTLSGVENGGETKESVTLSDLSEKATMKVYLNDTEIEYTLGAELTELGKYRVVLTDEAGNVAEYEFEILYKMNGGAIALIVIGVLAILGIILAIILGKRATYKKKVAQETDEDDEEDYEDENGDENGSETGASEEGETP